MKIESSQKLENLSGLLEIDKSIENTKNKLNCSLEIEKPLLNNLLSNLYREKQDLLLAQKDKLKEVYPELNPSFLSSYNIVSYDGKDFHIPKFTIYRVNGENRFAIQYSAGYYDRETWAIGWTGIVNFHAVFPKILRNELIKSVDFNYDDLIDYNNQRLREPIPYFFKIHNSKIIEKYSKSSYTAPFETSRFVFSTYLNGIVPEKTKEKINEGSKIFGIENLFFIAETKPNEWNINEVIEKKDPLLTGVIHDTCYLIDSFNLTPSEDYIRMEF